VKYRAAGGWGVRADVRAIATGKQPSGVTFDFEGLLSLYREWGRATVVKKKEVVAPPVVNDDPDGDGIHGAADKCPNEPEDKDGFQDEDGCPDLDNDNDGIPDDKDKCPKEAEDKDGFQDEDGCPDPDNDGDGIPDAQDKCPLEPETKNGYMDDDGCPDEIPERLKKFTGAIQGITFKINSADLLPGSYPILDKALAVLVEFKDVKLEIQGHTDDEPLVGHKGSKFSSNLELSQGRAESVTEYFVKKGVDPSRLTSKGYGDTVPVEDPKGLKGAKLNAARAKNRRVEFKLISKF
jgi:OOP family OmpA-OmpF porin